MGCPKHVRPGSITSLAQTRSSVNPDSSPTWTPFCRLSPRATGTLAAPAFMLQFRPYVHNIYVVHAPSSLCSPVGYLTAPSAHSRLAFFFFRISLFRLDKLPRLGLNTPLVEKHYVL